MNTCFSKYRLVRTVGLVCCLLFVCGPSVAWAQDDSTSRTTDTIAADGSTIADTVSDTAGDGMETSTIPTERDTTGSETDSRVEVSADSLISTSSDSPDTLTDDTARTGTAVVDSMPETATDSSSAAFAPPLFHTIQNWEISQAGVTVTHGHLSASAASLAAYLDRPFSPDAVTASQLSPLEWPRVFADERTGARRLRADCEALLTELGLSFRPVVVPDASDVPDSLTAALAADHPVVLNAPSLPVFYGYDRREPDTWWYFTESGENASLFESERVERFVLWDDDPAADLFWVITGPAAAPSGLPNAVADDYAFLRKIQQSVAGEPAAGIVPYPLSLRHLKDRFEQTDSLPGLTPPINRSDPIGIIAARAARADVEETLERLIPHALDTTLSAPLRLSLYFYHNSVALLDSMQTEFYGNGDNTITSLKRNWADAAKRRRGAGWLQDILRFERDALDALNRALAARDTQTQP
ncbi:MAG TPA: hypothetical protein VLB27_11220 [candidate division Zixibacteria bacterium]|nr:hypothetical protein [candidate division Zixibacteria bacterium]